jgi:arabinose-5-phosphate isomerase
VNQEVICDKTKKKSSYIKKIFEELFLEQKSYIGYFFDNVEIDQVYDFFEKLQSCQGTIFFTGIGKSGIVAQKIVASLISIGENSLYLSCSEALHGDVGMVKKDDVVVLLSKSGESDELLNLLPALEGKEATCLAVVSNATSRLANRCSSFVVLPLIRELCPFDLAPMTSATLQMIFGDILCVAFMKAKNITLAEFALNHPGGRIGKRATLKVKDIMLKGKSLPICSPEEKILDVLISLSNKQCGCLLVLNSEKELLGIFTDGDLRRAFVSFGEEALQKEVKSAMTLSPRTVGQDTFAWEALKKMEEVPNSPVTVLPVIKNKRAIGIVKMHDILQAGI